MERDKRKRKRSDHHNRHHAPAKGGEEAAAKAATQPSEEEVEEFFSILRRMNTVLKYFQKGGSDVIFAGEGERNPDSGDGNKPTGGGSGLDLNVVPEAEP